MSVTTKSQRPFTPVRSDINLPAQEEQVLAFWQSHKIFEKSVQQSQRTSSKNFSFYDGPPFATGLPHYGHLLAAVIKDAIPRYWTMKGYSVPRRFGWDCHGLPVEHEINKSLNLDSRKQIIEYGVDKYNAACRAIVMRYSEEWKKTVNRVGRWVDMDKPYFTMDVDFMQSVWWVFKNIWEQGLIYEGYKVVPYSVGLSTPLSNFEANSNYKQVQDPALTVRFKLTTDSNTSILAWTTTPWTLPSNLALAVGKEIAYVNVLEKATGNRYILAEALLGSAFKNPAEELSDIQHHTGQELIGLTYTPPLDYFSSKSKEGAFRVIAADHVTTESGTGIVHMAPAFGEEDYTACMKAGIPIVNPVDDDGMFTSEVPDFQGRRVKEADKDIILKLKGLGVIFKQETIEHSYPFCWRTNTPLIYRAVSSWFVSVEKIKDRLIKNNATTQWVPEHLRDGRFGKWLENARDWAISRNRFWGTPIPIWRNEEGEVLCIGSKEELERLSGQKVEDLHSDFIDPITIPSPTGKSALRRIDVVLDCWFESGSMPYAQWGYPLKNAEQFKKNFPADFIGEGLDQTRGWFYTLMVIGTALFDQAPFKNVVVNGLVLAEDGKKMSKSLRNFPDPADLLNNHGADALRLYLVDSPLLKAQELKFSEKGVTDVVRRILLRWWNSYSFFVNYANIDHFTPRGDAAHSPNILDQWLQSRLQTVIQKTQNEMAAYRLYNVVPGLLQFIEELTNTYIRFNRSHFWQEGMPESKRLAFETLYETLLQLSKLMAPFAPFLAETTFQNLIGVQSEVNRAESVHLTEFPEAVPSLIRPELEEAVAVMEALVMLGRNYREKIQVKAKIPLKSMTIIHRNSQVLENLKKFEPYFGTELNIQSVSYDSGEDQYIQVSAKANFTVLGPRLGKKMGPVAGAIGKLALTDILKLELGEVLPVEGEEIRLTDIEIRRAPKKSFPNIQISQHVSVDINPEVGPLQIQEGLAREVVRKIQAARKAADFILDDRIEIQLRCTGAIRAAVEHYQTMIQEETLAKVFSFSDSPQGQHTEKAEIEDQTVGIAITVLPR